MALIRDQLLGLVRGAAGESESAESEALRCDKCATVPSPETDFLHRIRGDGHTGFRSENPRVGGSIPPLGIDSGNSGWRR